MFFASSSNECSLGTHWTQQVNLKEYEHWGFTGRAVTTVDLDWQIEPACLIKWCEPAGLRKCCKPVWLKRFCDSLVWGVRQDWVKMWCFYWIYYQTACEKGWIFEKAKNVTLTSQTKLNLNTILIKHLWSHIFTNAENPSLFQLKLGKSDKIEYHKFIVTLKVSDFLVFKPWTMNQIHIWYIKITASESLQTCSVMCQIRRTNHFVNTGLGRNLEFSVPSKIKLTLGQSLWWLMLWS